LIAEAIVDAYGDDEQRVGFLTMLEERLEMPFEVQIPTRDRMGRSGSKRTAAGCAEGGRFTDGSSDTKSVRISDDLFASTEASPAP
jgi:Calcium binding